MLGVCLLFVGIVLINNGMSTLYNVNGKSAAVMNILTGGLSIFINAVNLVQGNYFGTIEGITGIAALGITADWRWAAIWYLWAVLWGTSFVEDICGKKLGKFVPVLQIFEGVATAWIPGLLMLIGAW